MALGTYRHRRAEEKKKSKGKALEHSSRTTERGVKQNIHSNLLLPVVEELFSF